MRKKEQIKHWNKIFKLGDKINKNLKLTEIEIADEVRRFKQDSHNLQGGG